MKGLRRLWIVLSNQLFIVALHLERTESHATRTTVRFGIYRATSIDEAIGKAVREHATEEWKLGAWKAGDLFALLLKV